MGGGRLEQMAGIVKFMAEFLLIHPAVRARPFVRVLRIDAAGGVKVAIWFLGGSNESDQVVNIGGGRGLGMHRQGVGGAFQDFVRVRIIKRIARSIQVGLRFAMQHPRGALKIIHPAGFLAFLKSIGDGGQPVGFNARRPKIIIQMHVREGDWLDRIIVLAGSELRAAGEGEEEQRGSQEALTQAQG